LRNIALNDDSQNDARERANPTIKTANQRRRKQPHPTAKRSGFRKSTNASGLVGVYPHRYGWSAKIGENGRLRHIGYFQTKELAAAAYRAAAQRRDAERHLRGRAEALARIRREEEAAKRMLNQLARWDATGGKSDVA
jgi:hypothetical protein